MPRECIGDGDSRGCFKVSPFFLKLQNGTSFSLFLNSVSKEDTFPGNAHLIDYALR